MAQNRWFANSAMLPSKIQSSVKLNLERTVEYRQSFLFAVGKKIMSSLFRDKRVFLVGIKGTGLSSLALWFDSVGTFVFGSDVKSAFNTEEKLKNGNITVYESFDETLVPKETDYLIYSAAYDKESHPQIVEAYKRGIPTYSYPQWIAYLTTLYPTYGISGTHGKTTTSALIDFILLQNGIKGFALYGSKLLCQREGSVKEFLILEACEYKDHFYLYDFKALLITTIDFDHPDYFKNKNEVFNSFKSVVKKLEKGTPVICCYDVPLVKKLVRWIEKENLDLKLMTYGFNKGSDFKLEAKGERLCLNGKVFNSPYRNNNLILNSVGGVLMVKTILNENDKFLFSALSLIQNFSGLQGRLERLFEKDQILYIDDYAHHPTEITTTVDQLRKSYPTKKIVLIFYPHTYSRTAKLFKKFVKSLKGIDYLFIRPIFLSQRNDGDTKTQIQLSKKLAKRTEAEFVETEEELIKKVAHTLQAGFLCVTMGAGNNNDLANKIAAFREKTEC